MKGECGTFSRLALDRHVPVMFGHHVADVVQSEAEAFHVMQVAVGHAVELVEHPLLVGFADADPFVCDREGRSLDDTVPLRVMRQAFSPEYLIAFPIRLLSMLYRWVRSAVTVICSGTSVVISTGLSDFSLNCSISGASSPATCIVSG